MWPWRTASRKLDSWSVKKIIVIIQEIRLVICKKIIIIRQIFMPPHASIADAKMSNKFKDILNTEAIHGGRFDQKAFTAEIWKGQCAKPKRPSLLHLSCPPTPWLLLCLWLWLLLWLWLCHNLCGGNPQVVAASHTRETLPPSHLLPPTMVLPPLEGHHTRHLKNVM